MFYRIMASDGVFKSRLAEVGLDDTAYWLKNMTELGVQSLASLRRDNESCDKLSQKARNKVEKRALLELLEITASDSLPTVSSIITSSPENQKSNFFITISEWNKATDTGPAEIETKLKHVLDEKQRVQSLKSGEMCWAKEYLSNELFFKFLDGIMQDCKSDAIKKIMLEVIDRNDWNYMKEEMLPQMKTCSWINEIYEPFDLKSITSLDRFDLFLLKTLESEKLLKYAKSAKTLALYISEGLYYLRHNYKQKYEDALILILTHPFTKDVMNDVVSLKPLSLSDLEFIQKMFVEKRESFKKCIDKSHLTLQAFLFLLAVSACSSKDERANRIFMKQIYFRMLEMELPLESEVSVLMKKYFDGSPFAVLKQSLKQLLVPPCQGRVQKLAQDKQNVLPQPEEAIEVIKMKIESVCYWEDEFTVLQKNPTVHAFLEKLGLCVHYPRKLRILDALCIREEALELSLKEASITDPKQLLFLIIQKLLAYDGLCRSNLMPSAQEFQCISGSSDDDNSDDEQSLKGNELEQDVVASSIHPIDCLLAIILCCDDFLTADLLSRLAKCQYALPFLIPDPFKDEFFIPLWAMSSIIKEWTSTNDSKQLVSHDCPITKYPMPIITFIRIGSNDQNNFSKSKVLNELISDSHHDYFFHRDCHGGQFNTLLGKGLVDMCWYLPSGNKEDYSFPDAVTFLNLHGDAREFKVQCQFLSQISFMCVAFLTEYDPSLEGEMEACFQKFNSLPGGIVFLNCFEKPPKLLKNIFPKLELYNLVLNEKSKTTTEIKDTIHSSICTKLMHMKDFRCIEDLCRQVNGTIIVMDEDSELYKKGLFHANKIEGMITSYKNRAALKDILPLQGDKLWKAWASCEKEVHRQMHKGAESVNEYSAKMEKEKEKIRNNQLKFVIDLTPVMKAFIDSIIEMADDKNLRNFYLQILKFKLNSISRENISQKLCNYKRIRREVSSLQTESPSQTHEVKAQISKLNKEMERLQEEIINSSLGLEHLLRELSQVYEASIDAKNREVLLDSQDIFKKYITCLPKIAAELLIEGYPLELMDGDAAHVPLQWVVAVINEAAVLLDDPKVFVLSVLGLQSTGKSTMLNTTFGLQFNVSAGRCTRGAFMQLLPLDDNLKKKTKCSYVIIVDTEGLHAPELDPAKTQKHDNELATFVIGLANMTLINIYGEVSGDIDDILQTSVHAFLRMSQIKHHHSCQFIHQNAGVNIKGEVSRAKFTQKLNQFTVDAAAEEHCKGQYEVFKDVIQFDDQKDVHYFPGLWKGDPPMAPVNPGYSHTAQSLKHQFIQDLCQRTSLKATSLEDARTGDLNLSLYHMTITDFWETLMKEKFVFSFKNTLEIKAYNSLEVAYSTWSWKFKSKMLEWEQKAENVIITESQDTLIQKVEEKLSELRSYVSIELYEPVREEMKVFFNGKQSEILIQWKAHFEIRLETLSRKLLSHAENHCNSLLKNRLTIHEFETDRLKSVDFIQKKVLEHIENVRSEQESLHKSLEKKKLTSEQLKSLLARDLFNPQQLSHLQEDNILTRYNVDMIKSHINVNGQFNENELKLILEQELSLSQAMKILKRPHLTDDELKSKFDKIWDELIKQLPTRRASSYSIRHEVEQALLSFIESQKGYHGQLTAKLNDKCLDKWDSNLKFVVDKAKHFEVKPTFTEYGRQFIRYVWGTTDEYEIEAKEVTAKIMSAAHHHLDSIKSKETAFNNAFVDDILKHVKETMKTCFNHKDRKINFTSDYKLDIYITVCSYSVGVFDKMAQRFEEKYDPRSYLEKNEKSPLYTKYKNQYKQTEAEVAIAETLCAYLDEPIRSQVRKSIGKRMVDKMKTSENYHFANKMALKLKILKDLKEEDKFDGYMVYVENIKWCMESRVKSYTIKYCNEKLPNSDTTNFQITANVEVSRLVKKVNSVLSGITSSSLKIWLSTFCKNDDLREELCFDLNIDNLLSSHDILEELNLKNFKDILREELHKLTARCQIFFSKIDCETEMINWKDQPHELLNDLIGCTEQCPFCKEQCDLMENHDCDHRTEVHRIDCLAGWRSRVTQEMSPAICPVLIDSQDSKFRRPDGGYQHYKDYKKVYKYWSIPPNKSPKSCLYWMWFVGKYKKQLAKRIHAKASKIPSDWSSITWQNINESLKTAYNIQV